MSSTAPLTSSKSRLALSLALLGLLFMSTLQAMEAGHLHPADELPGHCLLCKADGQSVSPVQYQPKLSLAPISRSTGVVPGPILVRQCKIPPLRGPPSYA